MTDALAVDTLTGSGPRFAIVGHFGRPALFEEEAEVFGGEAVLAEVPRAKITTPISMTTSQRMCSKKGDNFAIIKALHVVEPKDKVRRYM